MFPGSWHRSRACGLDGAQRGERLITRPSSSHWAANIAERSRARHCRNDLQSDQMILAPPTSSSTSILVMQQWCCVWIVILARWGVRTCLLYSGCLINILRLLVYDHFCKEQLCKQLGFYVYSFQLLILLSKLICISIILMHLQQYKQ